LKCFYYYLTIRYQFYLTKILKKFFLNISGVVDDRSMLYLKDFCIILMDPGQKYMLHKFGQQKIVCIDGTRGLIGYDFELVT